MDYYYYFYFCFIFLRFVKNIPTVFFLNELNLVFAKIEEYFQDMKDSSIISNSIPSSHISKTFCSDDCSFGMMKGFIDRLRISDSNISKRIENIYSTPPTVNNKINENEYSKRRINYLTTPSSKNFENIKNSNKYFHPRQEVLEFNFLYKNFKFINL
jgi:hypothetical protein